MNSASQRCLLCSNNVANCQYCVEIGGSCTACKTAFELDAIYQKCIDPLKGKLKKVYTYFDETDGSVSLVYNQKVKAKESELKMLEFTLIEKSGRLRRRRTDRRALQTTTSSPLKVDKIWIQKELKRVKAKLVMPDREIHEASISINTPEKRSIRSRSSPDRDYYDSEFPYIVLHVDHFKAKGKDAFKIIGLVTAIALGIATIFMVFVSLPMMTLIIQLFQFIDMFRLLRMELPVNSKLFLRKFNWNLMTIIPNFLKFDEDITRCKLRDVFYENEMSCLGFNSIGNILIKWVVLVVIKGIFGLLVMLVKPKKDKQAAGAQNEEKKEPGCLAALKRANGFFSAKFFFYIFLSAQIDILVNALVAVRFGEFEGFDNIVNYLFASFMILVYLVLTILTFVAGFGALMGRKSAKDSLVGGPESNRIHPSAGRKILGPAMKKGGSKEDLDIGLQNGGLPNLEMNKEGGEVKNNFQGDLNLLDDEEAAKKVESMTPDNTTNPANQSHKRKLFATVFEDYGEQKPLGCLLIPLYWFHGFALSYLIVYVREASVQIGILLVLFVLLLTLLIISKPFHKDKSIITTTGIIISSTVILGLVLALLIIVTDTDTMAADSNKNYKVLGYLIVLVLIVPVITAFIASIIVLVKLFRGNKGVTKNDALGDAKTGGDQQGVWGVNNDHQKAPINPEGGRDLNANIGEPANLNLKKNEVFEKNLKLDSKQSPRINLEGKGNPLNDSSEQRILNNKNNEFEQSIGQTGENSQPLASNQPGPTVGGPHSNGGSTSNFNMMSLNSKEPSRVNENSKVGLGQEGPEQQQQPGSKPVIVTSSSAGVLKKKVNGLGEGTSLNNLGGQEGNGNTQSTPMVISGPNGGGQKGGVGAGVSGKDMPVIGE